MRKEFYFLTSNAAFCWDEKHFQDIMKDEGLSEIEVHKAEPDKESHIFWCEENSFCGFDTSETCGESNCDQYQPRNGKNGRCKFHSTTLYTHGEKIILKIK